MGKLTKEDVAAIREELGQGKSQRSLAEQYGVSRSTIADISTGRTRKDISVASRISELEVENVHLREERNRALARSKAIAREEGLFQAMSGALEDRVAAMKPLPPARKLGGKAEIEEHVVMHLSDGHHDQIVRPEECGGLEEYDFQISCCRAERYVDTVIQWTQETLAPRFRFPHLWILANGDHTSGEIHNHVERSYYKNQFQNCLAIGKLHALMIRDLAPYFEHVHVVYVPGNHGRRTNKKDHHGAHDNWDYLVAQTTKQFCRDLGNTDFVIPDAFSINLDINGVGFCVAHGDDVKSSLGLPWYGLQRRHRSMIALGHKHNGPRIRYFCCGHFHKPGTVGDMDCELLVNGPWLATDAYAYNTYAGYTEPSQWLHGVNPKFGITWRLNVLLRTENEKAWTGQRYRIEI